MKNYKKNNNLKKNGQMKFREFLKLSINYKMTMLVL